MTSEPEKSKLLFEKAKKMIPGGVHSPVRAFKGVGGVPRFMSRAKGAEIFDVDGNSYIDFCMSWGPLLLGHCDEEVENSVHEALGRGWSFGTADPYSLELAELITGTLPWVEKVRFVNSGTEAVMAALRLARAVTGRRKILKFEGCYHGHVDSMLVRAGSGLAEAASPDSAGVSKEVAEETVVVPLNDLQSVQRAMEVHGKDLAAVIVEPIPANNGLLVQEPSFLFEVEKLTRANGSLLIFDEVITGFRVAWGGMAERTGIRPDLVTYGKIIGGGFPVGAYGGKAEWMNWVAPEGPVYQAGTLSGNPIAMVAGLSSLKKIRRLNLYSSLESKTTRLAEDLNRSLKEADLPGWVQHAGSIFWIVFSDDSERKWVRSISEISPLQKKIYPGFFHGLLNASKQKVYLPPSSFEVGFLSSAHQDFHLEALREATREVRSPRAAL